MVRRIRQQLVELPKLPLVVSLFFLMLWLAGIATGEPGRVLEQAWQVCLSCIGIG